MHEVDARSLKLSQRRKDSQWKWFEFGSGKDGPRCDPGVSENFESLAPPSPAKSPKVETAEGGKRAGPATASKAIGRH
jgi:hypothetical protein